MLQGSLNMLRSNGRAVSITMRNLLAAHGRHAHFRFDLGHGKGKKSPNHTP
ncbi:hypothetical protein [Mesorhizobium sp. M1322]|uniref:hypothetical protein n=1 Tax=Mesorhizobium sp. M1322 TaxID=2957081 RepID=UPI00333510A7